MLPPIDSSITFILLSRQYRDEMVTVYLPWGDSYYLSSSDVRMYLKKLGYEEYDEVVDYFWNFNNVVVDIESGTFESVSAEDMMAIAKSLRRKERAVSSLVSILEKNREQAVA